MGIAVPLLLHFCEPIKHRLLSGSCSRFVEMFLDRRLTRNGIPVEIIAKDFECPLN
jgi:hypothetical protein